MSRLDYVTISIVVICLIALGFLVYKTIGLMTADTSKKQPLTEQTVEEDTGTDTYDQVDSLATDDLDDDDVTGILDDPNDDISQDDLAQDGADLESTTSSDYTADDEYESNSGGNTSEDEASSDTYTDDTPVEPTRPASYDEGQYMVLAGSYRQQVNAENQVKKLKSNGFENARVAKFNNSTYAVALVDRFANVSDARMLVSELRNRGFEAFVKKQE